MIGSETKTGDLRVENCNVLQLGINLVVHGIGTSIIRGDWRFWSIHIEGPWRSFDHTHLLTHLLTHYSVSYSLSHSHTIQYNTIQLAFSDTPKQNQCLARRREYIITIPSIPTQRKLK